MILVFGETGQVATELKLYENVFSIGRDIVDLADAGSCAKVIGKYKPAAVINAAAFTSVDAAEQHEVIATAINSDAPAAMAKACKKLDIPFVHLSTDYVFEGSGEEAWKPEDPTNPQNAYGRCKLKGEKAIRAYNAVSVILRTSWVISAHRNNFVKTMLHLSNRQDEIKIVSDQIGGPTPAYDIAKACISIADQLIKDPTKAGTFHFCGAPNVSWCQFAETIFKKAGRSTKAIPIFSSEYPTPAKRPLNSRLDCSKTFEVFSLSQPSWELGLRNIINDLGMSK